jgi:hypothetical protein
VQRRALGPPTWALLAALSGPDQWGSHDRAPLRSPNGWLWRLLRPALTVPSRALVRAKFSLPQRTIAHIQPAKRWFQTMARKLHNITCRSMAFTGTRARFKWGENDASQVSDCHNGACAAWLQPAIWRTTGGRAVSVAGARGILRANGASAAGARGIRRAGTGSLGVRRAVGATAAASRNIRETRCCLPRAGAAA